jgi:hypothetical protein
MVLEKRLQKILGSIFFNFLFCGLGTFKLRINGENFKFRSLLVAEKFIVKVDPLKI